MRTTASVLLLPCLLLCACPSLQNYYRNVDDTRRELDVSYVADDLPKHRLDLYLPEDAHGAFPVVVFVHGGYWHSQDKNTLQPLTGLYGNVGTSLAELGIGCAVISYRLFPTAHLDDMLDDVVAALAWTRDAVASRGGDPTALFLAGHSAGGHLVAFLGTHPEELRVRGVEPSGVRGVISLSGVYNIEATSHRVEPKLRDEVFLPLFGRSPEQQLRASPKEGFGPKMLPTYFIDGENDYPGCKADHAEAQQLLAPLVGDRAWFDTIPGNTHEDMVFEIGTKDDEVIPKMVGFIRMMR